MTGGSQELCVFGGDAVVGDEPFAARSGKLRQRRLNLGEPVGIDLNVNQVWFREIAVVVRFFFAAHCCSFAGAGIEQQRLLDNLASLIQNPCLPLHLVLHRVKQFLKRVLVLNLGARA